MSFSVVTVVFALLLAAGACILWFGPGKWPQLHSRLPRARIAGEVLGITCLIWAASHVIGMLEGDMLRFVPTIKLIVPALAVLAYFYLDFLFARALGGFLLLIIHQLLHAAFVEDIALRPLFSLLCYLLAFLGLYFITAPWGMRAILEKARDSKSWQRTTSALLAGLAVAFFGFATMG